LRGDIVAQYCNVCGDGTADGATVGDAVGVIDGQRLGRTLGDTVGPEVGVVDGDADGLTDGDTVGAEVGVADGDDDDIDKSAVEQLDKRLSDSVAHTNRAPPVAQ